MNKTDKQIDEIQDSIADKLELIAEKFNRKISRSLQICDMNNGKPELIKRDLVDMSLYVDDIKNLASDLKRDARL